MNRWIIFTLIFVFFFLFGGLAGLVYVSTEEVFSPDDTEPTPTVVPSPIPTIPLTPLPSLMFTPAAQSITGSVSDVQGEIEIRKRYEKEFRDMVEGDRYVIGESIITREDGSATVTFEGVGELAIDSFTELNSISFLPTNFTVQQVSGSVGYAVTAEGRTITVRNKASITKLEEGEYVYSVDERTGDSTIEVLAGRATVAFLDPEFNTLVRTVEEGEVAIIDVSAQDVDIET